MPPTAPDIESVGLLRRSGKHIVFAANKIDNPKIAEGSTDLYAIGLTDFIVMSALHGRGIAELEAAIVSHLPKSEPVVEAPEGDDIARIAIIGRPNAGKSSLFNRLTGSERSLVDSVAGTTRDPVNADVVFEQRKFHIVDTAGIRRRRSVEQHSVESASVFGAIRAMEQADAAVVLCDAQEGIADQDLRLLSLCADRGRAIIVGLNKCDLLDRTARKEALAQAKDALRFATWATIIPVSAKTGYGLSELMLAAHKGCEQMRRRVSTGELNRFFEQVIANHTPPTQGGRAPRIYYITQVGTSPPTFVAKSNAPDNIATSYQRYISNQIRKAFGFESVPIVVYYRAKERTAEHD
jgi:GTP-binding protein